MKNVENKSGTSEKINAAMMEDKDFCIRIVNCKDRDEVKKFLSSKDIEASDNDIDNLAENISEIADICKKIDDKELEDITGGADPDYWGPFSSKAAKGVGISAVVVAGVLVLSFVGAGIKKLGDQKGWWDKYRRQT